MKYTITMDRPSIRYDEALMLGNGRLGAMVSGGSQQRLIWLNEETLWYGGPRDRNNPDARSHIDRIRQLMHEDRVAEAEQLAVLTLTGVPESQRHYTTLGLLVLDMINHDGTIENYQHRLDFESACVRTTYRLCGVDYEMDVITSAPDQVIAIRLRANAPVLSFHVGLERGERVAQFSYGTHEDDVIRDVAETGVILSGTSGGRKGLDFSIALYGLCDGTMQVIGDKLACSNAQEAELYIAAATNFQMPESFDPSTLCSYRACAARKKGFEACMRDHLLEWQPRYARAEISLDALKGFEPPAMNRLFDAYAGDKCTLTDLGSPQWQRQLEVYIPLLFFHFGRYLLLSSSRDCQLPAALQGIWCRDLLSVWDGKFTTNINLQMNYWPVDSANLSECFEPYLSLAERIRENGCITAQKMYGCRGFVLHNNTDIWADTAVQDSGTHCSYWFLGGVWIACDMYEHFRYTRDPLLLQRIWPILRDAARFVLDFMQRQGDELVMGVTSSPENFYYNSRGEKLSFCEMTAMDSQMIALLFRECCEAESILRSYNLTAEADEDFLAEVNEALQILRPTRIGMDGTILEWGMEVAGEAEPMHRHLSHLIGAYPYDQIAEVDIELFRAVEASLNKRIRNGGCNTGWGRAWGAGLMARLKRGDDALEMIGSLLKRSSQPNLMSCCNIGRVPKLLENDKPMQLDGNMGAVQAIVEMLLQSHRGVLQLLPALPSGWRDGGFRGLIARGGIEVNVTWRDGQLTEATLTPRYDGEIALLCTYPCHIEQDGFIYEAEFEVAHIPGKANRPCHIVARKEVSS